MLTQSTAPMNQPTTPLRWPRSLVQDHLRDHFAMLFYEALGAYHGLAVQPWAEAPFSVKEWLREAMEENFEGGRWIAEHCQVQPLDHARLLDIARHPDARD